MGSITSNNHTKLTFQYMRVNGQAETLLGFLLRKFRYHDRDGWLEHIDMGRLQVNQREGDPNQLLKNGQIITYMRPDYLEPEVDPYFEILYEDEYLIAVNKSGNLPTSPSGRYFKNTLVHLIKKALDWDDVFTLHRLDRETSGVLVFAKQKSIAQAMAALFRTQQVKKKYLAILSQPLPCPEVFVSMPLGKQLDGQIRIKQAVLPTGKPSQTLFTELERMGSYTKVKVTPQTGRTHQIRIHAAQIGCSIVGDKLYGLSEDAYLHWLNKGDAYLESQNFPTHRQLLHAWQLQFQHPVTEKTMILEAPDTLLMQHLSNHATETVH